MVLSLITPLLGLYASSAVASITQKPLLINAGDVYDFKAIKPSTSLEWKSCYDGYQCARLDVPLDWSDHPVTDKRASIAIAKLPAKVNVTDPRYDGAILLNPGGPGGSGVGLLLRNGKSIQTIADSDEELLHLDSASSSAKFYDIISWDPRGINHTTPAIHCFPDVVQRALWFNDEAAQGILGSSDTAFDQAWVRHEMLSKSCSEAEAGTGGPRIGEFVNTASVVHDMVEIIERLGEWREKEAKRLLAQTSTSSRQSAEVLARTAWQKGKEKIQYWGFSYGTVLGATFSAMNPDRVSRVILDGVVDTDDYYNGTWLKNLQDTDHIIDRFAEYCYDAGSKNCSMYSDSAKDIRGRFDSIIHSLKKTPLGVSASKFRGPAVITYSDLKALIGNVVYKPYAQFKMLSDVMSGIERGNGTLLANQKLSNEDPPHLTTECREKGPYSDACNPVPLAGSSPEIQSSILCSDAVDQTHLTKKDFVEYWHTLQSQSETLGDGWTEIRMGCAFWNITARNKFDGPIGGKTASPILFIGNTYDPVTPLRNAFTMSNKFYGSTVLHQESEGHCSSAGPSVCSAKIIREYFQTGKLPKKGTTCPQDESPFGGRLSSSTVARSASSSDARLLEAVRDIALEGFF